MSEPSPLHAASTDAAIAVIRGIRKGIRIRRKQRAEDATTIRMQQLAQVWRHEATRLERIAPGSEEHRAAVNAAKALEQLPRHSLRCLTSTLDEERDFALRCADLKLLRAEHALKTCRIDRHRILEGGNGQDPTTLKPLTEETSRLRSRILAQTVEMAETPVRNRRHLELKRRLIGRIWLGASGEPFDRMRAAIADDEAWLKAHRSRPARARQPLAD